MKMTSGLIWGIIIIFIGLSIIIKVVFNVNFPILKILIGLFFIYLGLKIIFDIPNLGSFGKSGNNVMFGERRINHLSGNNNNFNVMFGKTTLDLRDIELKYRVTKVELNTIFGGSEIILNKNTPVKIKLDAAFGGANLPDRNIGGFGTSIYTSDNLNENENYLYIKGSVIFGGLDIMFK